jgi:E3 ubiquitin-protein ligase RNF14
MDDEAEEQQQQQQTTTEPPPAKVPSTSSRERAVAICEACNFAFCVRCHKSWHGDFVACRAMVPEGSSEISEEELASLRFIRQNTSECPACQSPVVKAYGCNHMTCSCGTHFCYLCGTWLDPQNPYKHFNKVDEPCYGRLWDMDDGDEGNGAVQFGGARGYEAEFDDDVGGGQ